MQNADIARPSFGRWLIDQAQRDDQIGALAKCAAADPKFPRNGAPRDIWQRLNQLEADTDLLQAMEDAEADWGALQ